MFLEGLEDRRLLASGDLRSNATTELSATLSAGALTISDTSTSGASNDLSVSVRGTNLVISDAVEQFSEAPEGGSLSNGNRTLTLPIASITGSLTFNTLGGNDTVTVDLAGGDAIPAGGITFNGGNPTSGPGDKLVITGGSQGTVTYNYTNANDGDIVMSNFGTVTYTGLEPITNSGTATDVIFNLPAAASVATLGDDGTIGNGLSRLSSAPATFELTDFSNPTGSLTINPGSANDTLVTEALPDFGASLNLGTTANRFNSLTWNGAVTLAANQSLVAFATGTILLPNATSDVATSGTGAIALTTARNINLSSGASITAVNGDVTLSGNMQTPSTNEYFRAIELLGGVVQTTGMGNVTVAGRGGALAGIGPAHGIRLNSLGTRISSVGGNVQLTGLGGASGGSKGIEMDEAIVSAGGAGSVTVQGTGGTSPTAQENHGVYITGASSLVASAGGPVIIQGTGGGSAANNINWGVVIGGTVSNSGTGAASTVTIRGFGGNTTGDSNDGVVVAGLVTSSGGPVLVEGTGGGSGNSELNVGVTIGTSGRVTSDGTGPSATVTVRGFGAPNVTGQNNYGVELRNTGLVTSAGGPVLVEGTGGGSGINGGVGIVVQGDAIITSAGTSAQAAVTVRGFGNNSGGVSVGNRGQITSNGGPVSVEGTAGPAGSGYAGVTVNGSAGRITSSGGAITVTGNGGPSGHAVRISSGGQILGTSGTSPLTVIGDSLDLTTPTSIDAGTNQVIIRPRTSIGINLGGADVFGATPVLGLTDAELDRISGSVVNIGNSSTGAISVTAPITQLNHLVITTGAGATVSESVTMVSDKNLTLTALGTTNGAISLPNSTSDLAASGTGAITLTTARSVSLSSGASITTVNGSLTLHANQQVTPSTGNFVGVDVNGLIQSTGTGAVTVKGRGGNGPGAQYGVSLSFNGDGDIIGGTTGALLVEGTGGPGTSSGNYGVEIRGPNAPSITSAGANVTVTGFGGGSGSTQSNLGVEVGPNATISAGGSGTVLVQGTGGATTGTSNHGVQVTGTAALITSSGGAVQVIGQGGGSGSSGSNAGIYLLSNGTISAGGSATVNVQGTGGTSSGGTNVGVWLFAGNPFITSSGGNVTVVGQGAGTGTFGANGVTNNGTITAGGAGTVSVQGTASATNIAGSNMGISVTGTISSNGGNVTVTGTGVGSGIATNNVGVSVSGLITAGNTGTVTVQGTGGAGNNSNYGVDLTGVSGTISSSGGNVSVVGQGGGGAANGSSNIGVRLGTGTFIQAAGAGTVSVQGTGGTGISPGNSHHGIELAGGTVTSAGGNIQVTGQGGGLAGSTSNMGVRIASNAAITVPGAGNIVIDAAGGVGTQSDAFNMGRLGTGGSVVATGTGNITIIADQMVIDPSATINGGSNLVFLRQKTNGLAIDLGAADAVGTLGLNDAELDRVTAVNLRIGSPTAGAITVSSDITRPAASNLELISGADVLISGGQINTAGGMLLLDSGIAPAAVRATKSGVDVTTSNLTFAGDLAFVLNGTTVDTQYTQLNVVGQVNLASMNLVLYGSYAPLGLQPFILVNNDGSDPIVGTFAGLPEGAIISNVLGSGHNAAISYVGGDGNDVVLTIHPNTFFVTSLVPTTTGAVLNFSRDLGPSTLNLYDLEGATFGPADVTLVGATVGAVRGSVVIDPTLRRLTFISTVGTLAADSYTLTLRSAVDGFVDSTAALLDGDANGTAGANYVRTFSVTAPPAGAVTVSLSNFARGPQQPVNIPASVTSGLPIAFSDGGGITSASFQLRYNPALLTIASAAVAPGLPAGAAVMLDVSTPGIAIIQFTSPAPLATGTTRFIDLIASVPTTATYRSKHVLDVTSIVLNGGSVPAVDDDALHIASYFGDATGNGAYSAQDASRVARVAVGLDSGLQLFRLLDPVIMIDVSGNGAISATDTSRVLQVSVGFPVAEIPALPSPAVSLVQGGPDPKLSIPTDLVAAPGDKLQIPVMIDSIVDLTGNGLESAELVIYYDASVLDVNQATLGSLTAQAGGQWFIASRIEPLAGRVIVSLAGTAPIEGFFQGELVSLQAQVKTSARAGTSAINLAASSRDPSIFTQLNDGYLTLIPAPTDAANDPGVDGLLTILSAAVDSGAGRATTKPVNDQLLITGTSGDDRIWIAPYGADQLRVRGNHQILGTFAMPSSLAIDALTGEDYIVSAFVNGPALIAAADNTQDLIFSSGQCRVVESPSVGDPVRNAVGPTVTLSPHELALLQLLADWNSELSDQAARHEPFSAGRLRRRYLE